MTKKITDNQMRNWIGSDNTERDAIAILVCIANGDYKPSLLKKEVLQFNDTL